jgi:hypothetical protein
MNNNIQQAKAADPIRPKKRKRITVAEERKRKLEMEKEIKRLEKLLERLKKINEK